MTTEEKMTGLATMASTLMRTMVPAMATGTMN